MNYQTIKQLAQDHRLRVKDLIALAPNNDPYYIGKPAEIRNAEWFATLWQQFGYANNIHLRRVHYRTVSQDPPIQLPTTLTWTDKTTGQKHSTTTYQNTDRCWQFLVEAGKSARYLGLVPAEDFIDRRNPQAIINAYWPGPDSWDYEDPQPGYNISPGETHDEYGVPDLPEFDPLPDQLPAPPRLNATGYTAIQQTYHLEVWAEKTTMNDILEPICHNYRVNLVTGMGELSISAVVQLIARILDADRPARILYISDYDPAGFGMPISVARKIEFFIDSLEGACDVRLTPIILTHDQVALYNLPRIPVKDSDKRKARWEATQGGGAVELDALEALHPGQLETIVEDELLKFYDPDLSDRAWFARQELQRHLNGQRQAIIDRHQDALGHLETTYSAVLADYDALKDEIAQELEQLFTADLAHLNDRLIDTLSDLEQLHSTIHDDLNERTRSVDLSQFPLPAPDLPAEPNDILYDSRRSYLDQLIYYKDYRNGTQTVTTNGEPNHA